uniref:Uncharacterized protein n=1 Tax=Pavo cristatus TaxID=9049 RepID=A0A8C9FN38_PAVCR
MEELVAGVERIGFDVEADMEQQGGQLLPFPGKDKLGAAVREFFTRGLCTRGECCEGFRVGGTRVTLQSPGDIRELDGAPLCSVTAP